jgi:hypothetical protein
MENTSSDVQDVREAIALVQVLPLHEHPGAYDQIHARLEEALRSIDGM